MFEDSCAAHMKTHASATTAQRPVPIVPVARCPDEGAKSKQNLIIKQKKKTQHMAVSHFFRGIVFLKAVRS